MDGQPELRLVTSTAMSSGLACVHHWLLGEPVNNRILGRCKRCGAQRVYANSVEGTDRFDDYRELTATSSYYPDQRSA